MQNNYITDYIESKGFTVAECYRPAKKEVPANMRDRYSSYEEYQEALHDFLTDYELRRNPQSLEQ